MSKTVAVTDKKTLPHGTIIIVAVVVVVVVVLLHAFIIFTFLVIEMLRQTSF
jgi:hypothetical protein